MTHRTILLAALGTLLLASPALAQRSFGGRSGPAGHAPTGRPAPHGGRGSFGYAHHFHSGSGFRRGGFGYGWGWDYPFFADDYDRGEQYARPDYEPPAQTAPPQVAFLPPEPEKLIQPILIERQGESWVQVSSYKEARVSGDVGPQKSVQAAPSAAAAPVAESARLVTELPPAVLVFRDGHQEEIRSYTIIGNVLTAKADYWASGEWTRKIEIANLDVPATVKLNQDRGYRFRLPSNPQEVVIRP